jgi:hypothetical protein
MTADTVPPSTYPNILDAGLPSIAYDQLITRGRRSGSDSCLSWYLGRLCDSSAVMSRNTQPDNRSTQLPRVTTRTNNSSSSGAIFAG